MASMGKDALTVKGTHTVGQVNSWNMETFINGAIVEDKDGVDNFRLVELYFNEDEEACVRYATAATSATSMFVTVTPEERLEGEQLNAFYNGQGEMAAIAYLSQGFTFETSAIVAEGLKIGDTVIPGADGKFEAGTEAEKVFQVTDIELDAMYSIDSQELVQLTVIK